MKKHQEPIEAIDDDVLQNLSEEELSGLQSVEEPVEYKSARIEIPAERRTVKKVATIGQIPRYEQPIKQAQGAEADIYERIIGVQKTEANIQHMEQEKIRGNVAFAREPEPQEGASSQPGRTRKQDAGEGLTLAEVSRRQHIKLRNELGPLIEILKRPTVSDIFRNPDGLMFVNETGFGTFQLNEDVEMSDEQVMSLIGTVASLSGVPTDESHPYVETMLPRGAARFSSVRPPYTNGGPMFSIRRPSPSSKTLDDYMKEGSLSGNFASAIRKGIRRRDNMLIVGATASGKTTLANAILAEIADSDAGPNERFIILEDQPELRCDAVNVVYFQTGPYMDLTSLLARCMRHSPTSITVGEVRGKEAHVLLKAWNTGHSGGITTIHAPDARRALTRLESLISESGMRADKEEIVAAVNMIVVIKKDTRGTRTVSEVRRLTGVTSNDYILRDA